MPSGLTALPLSQLTIFNPRYHTITPPKSGASPSINRPSIDRLSIQTHVATLPHIPSHPDKTMRLFLCKLSLFTNTLPKPYIAPTIQPHLYNTLLTPLRRTMATLRADLKVACIQLASGPDKPTNLHHAHQKVLEAAATGAKLVVLPECFNSPYGTSFFPRYAEVLTPGIPPASQAPSYHALSAMARAAGVYLVGGSIPEKDPATGKFYNTSLIFGKEGQLLGKHQKVHLFDIDIPGKITFRESEVLSPGKHATVVELPEYGRISVAICYDIRFPALAAIAAENGCFAMVVPGAFNLVTGPLHWRLLAQARAVDSQFYAVLCSPARDLGASYHAWGHSLVVDPMAKVLVEAEEKETIVTADLRETEIVNARSGIPITTQGRYDVYKNVAKGAKVEIS